jgi:hypothetical protein
MYFTEEKERTAETLRPGLEFDNFKPRLESGIFNYVFWLTVHFLVLIRVSCKRESKACLMSQIFASSLAKFFLSSHPWSILLALENLKRQLFPFRERRPCSANLPSFVSLFGRSSDAGHLKTNKIHPTFFFLAFWHFLWLSKMLI